MIHVVSVTMKKQFIKFLVTCFSEVRSTSSSDEGSDGNVDETNESPKQKKVRLFFLKIISLLVISKFMFAVVIRMMGL